MVQFDLSITLSRNRALPPPRALVPRALAFVPYLTPAEVSLLAQACQ